MLEKIANTARKAWIRFPYSSEILYSLPGYYCGGTLGICRNLIKEVRETQRRKQDERAFDNIKGYFRTKYELMYAYVRHGR